MATALLGSNNTFNSLSFANMEKKNVSFHTQFLNCYHCVLQMATKSTIFWLIWMFKVTQHWIRLAVDNLT